LEAGWVLGSRMGGGEDEKKKKKTITCALREMQEEQDRMKESGRSHLHPK